MRLLLLVLHFALVSITIHGQEVRNPTPPKPSLPTLQITATTATGADYKPMLGAMTCDGAGTVYVPLQNLSVQSGWNQLIAFDRKGETRTVTLKLPEGFTARRMFMSESGFLYLMAQNTKRPEKVEYWIPDVYVIRFDRNGEYDSKLKLDASFLPSGSFAVFPSGEIIVAGLEARKIGEKETPKTPFMALFDSHGQFIKRIVAEDDEWIGEAVRSGKDGKVAPGKGVNSAVESGLTVMGSDGNAYVMRKSSPAVVYVIANDGRLMRTLKLSADETNLFPSAFFESDRELAVLFSAFGPSERRIKTFHNETGQMIKEASVDDTFGVSVTCFKAPGSFTFIRALDGKFVIHTAELR